VTNQSDQIYYRDGGRFWLARRISHVGRLRIYQDFLRKEMVVIDANHVRLDRRAHMAGPNDYWSG
jgi:hypothetical protein